MKKILIFMFLFLTLINSVFGINVISSSNIDFESNNELYDGNAFVVTSIENKGNDIVTWSMGNFESNLDDGYVMEKSGEITSEFNNLGWDYSLNYKASGYDLVQAGDRKYFWTFSGAEDWCFNEKKGDIVAMTSNLFYYVCLDIQETERIYSLSQGSYKYELNYFLDIFGEGTDKIELDLKDTKTSAGSMIGDKNWFNINKVTHGVPIKSDPDIDDKTYLMYDIETSTWKQIVTYYPFSEGSWNSIFDYYKECYEGDFIDGAFNWDDCITETNVMKDNLKYVDYINSLSNLDSSFLSYDSSNGKISGVLKYDDGFIYRNPVVTLTINADKLGVKRTFSEAEFVSVEYPNVMNVGQSYPITITIKNVGEADMEYALNFDGDDYKIDYINQIGTLDKGEIKTLEGRISYRKSVSGCELNVVDKITIGNSKAVGVDDTHIISMKVCQPSECSIEGETTCFGDAVRKCTNVNGVLKYETITTCTTKCVILDGNAQCSNEKSVCGDDICASDEVEDAVRYCPKDCDEKPPLCGDGICDGREKQGEPYECLTTETYFGVKGDCPEEQKDPLDTFFIFFVVLSVILVISAFYFRMKKEGYF